MPKPAEREALKAAAAAKGELAAPIDPLEEAAKARKLLQLRPYRLC